MLDKDGDDQITFEEIKSFLGELMNIMKQK